jgi:predicted nucleic acid-binding protein
MGALTKVWVDTGALLALASPRDQHHGNAVTTLRQHTAAGVRWTSSVLVLAEFHLLAVQRRGSAAARASVSALLADTGYEWLDVPVGLVREAMSNWLDRFQGQSFSLADAVSFELMQRERISHAFAFDKHFVAAGFELLR